MVPLGDLQSEDVVSCFKSLLMSLFDGLESMDMFKEMIFFCLNFILTMEIRYSPVSIE